MDVWFDPDKIEKIVFNLLSNAIKFTPPNKTVLLEIKTENLEKESIVQLDHHKSLGIKNWINIIVSDTGIGISKSNLEKIFDRFYQVNDHSTKIAGGTGIGLSVVKEMIRIHFGSINVESTLGVGTTFSVKIPVLDHEIIEGIVYSGIVNKFEHIPKYSNS